MIALATMANGPASGASTEILLLVAFVGVALAVSFLCSILEAALLSIREAELEERAQKGHNGSKVLLGIKKERLDDAISAILILNTIAHTAGVAGAGLQAGKIWTDSPFMLGVVFPSVLTLLILVGTEIIPKTLGAVHASRLVGPVASTLRLLLLLMTPLLMLTRLITGALASHEQPSVSRGELAAMVAMAARQGTLARQDSMLLANALRFNSIRVEDVMTPRTVVAMVEETSTVGELIAQSTASSYSRVPTFREDRDHVLGYVVRQEVLSALAEDPATQDRSVREFSRGILFIDQQASVSQALKKLIEAKEHLAMVTDSYGGVAGLVSLEDLVETLLGVEIVDETDKVADLRKEAAALREKRLRSRLAALGNEALNEELRAITGDAPASKAGDGPASAASTTEAAEPKDKGVVP